MPLSSNLGYARIISLILMYFKSKIIILMHFGISHKLRDIFMDIMLQRILELVGSRHGSGQELVKALGLSRNAVTDWKSGRVKSYPKYAPQIAAYYGVSLDWLSGASDEKEQKNSPIPEEDEAALLRRKIGDQLNDMSEDQLEKLLAVIDLICSP